MASIEEQAKKFAKSIYNLVGGENNTDIFMATVSHYDEATGNLYVLLDGNTTEVKAIPVGEHYDIGRRVMCSVNNFGNLFAIGQNDKEVQQLMKRAYLSSDEVEAGNSVQCLVELEQKDAVLAYEWQSSIYPDRKRSGISYTTTDADVGDVIFCRVYDKSGKYSGFLTSGTCIINSRYDPSVDYDFGTAIRTGSLGSQTYGSYVQLKSELGGELAKLELNIYNGLSSSSQSRQPVFVSDFVCLSVNASGYIGIFTHGGGSDNIEPYFGVTGNDWKYTSFGNWNKNYRVVVENDKVYVNDSLIVSGIINSGWGTTAPKWGGKNLDNDGWVQTDIKPSKFYVDGQLVLDLVPAKIKNLPDSDPGNVGLYDLVEDEFYPGSGRLVFVGTEAKNGSIVVESSGDKSTKNVLPDFGDIDRYDSSEYSRP